MVPLNESWTYPGLHLSEKTNKDLLKQIQKDRRKWFHISKVELNLAPLMESKMYHAKSLLT